MRLIVHVIEETSIHKEINNKYEIQECEVGDGSTAHVLLTDSFYLIEAEEPVDAVIEIANIIRAEDEDGDRVKLGLLLKRQKEKEDIDEKLKNKLSTYINEYIVEDKTNSNLFSSTYQLEKKIDDEEYIELHKFFFYVTKENEIMQIKEK